MASINIILTACLVLTSTVPATAQESRWPLEGPVKTPSKALEVPTRLAPMSESLTDILNSGGRIVSSYIGKAGPVVTVVRKSKWTVCIVTAQDPKTDQNVATSECYALN